MYVFHVRLHIEEMHRRWMFRKHVDINAVVISPHIM